MAMSLSMWGTLEKRENIVRIICVVIFQTDEVPEGMKCFSTNIFMILPSFIKPLAGKQKHLHHNSKLANYKPKVRVLWPPPYKHVLLNLYVHN